MSNNQYLWLAVVIGCLLGSLVGLAGLAVRINQCAAKLDVDSFEAVNNGVNHRLNKLEEWAEHIGDWPYDDKAKAAEAKRREVRWGSMKRLHDGMSDGPEKEEDEKQLREMYLEKFK